jgi:hypothetical protein
MSAAGVNVLAHLWRPVVIDDRTGIPSIVVWRADGRSEKAAFGGLGDRML